jgi:hypothetical protein
MRTVGLVEKKPKKKATPPKKAKGSGGEKNAEN